MCKFLLKALCVIIAVILLVLINTRAAAAEEDPHSDFAAKAIYTEITGLTPDQIALAWLATHKTVQDLQNLRAYLLSLGYRPKGEYNLQDISVPVLMYHYISPPGQGAAEYWSTSYEEFEKQMAWFYQNGFSSITVDELYEFIATGKIENLRSFVPIFDDNWHESVINRVIPVMKKYGFIPTLALYTNGIYESGEGVFTWPELSALQKANIIDVQSHSVSHPLIPALNQLPDAALWQELYSSKRIIEQKLSKTVNGFIAPGGSVDDRVLDFANRAGYKTFFLLWEKSGIKYGGNPFWIYRVNMVNTLDFTSFVEKMEQYATKVLPIPKNDSVLASNQIVAYYGHPYSSLMGILGEYSAEELVGLLKDKAGAYDVLNGPRGVISAFHIVFGTVQPRGLIGVIDEETLLRYIELARQNNMLVILDHQIGRGTVAEAVSQMLSYLKYDNVHLAIDPEWHTPVPMEEIGDISGYDVNEAQRLMQQYLIDHNIPGKKILIVHQFAPIMITEREVISADYLRVDLVHDMDGFGHPITKNYHYEYNKLATNMPLKGFKLFYAGARAWGYDNPLMTPSEVLALDPAPVVIIYQ